jgi:ion channel-forming bestrophin family protein
MITSRNLRIGLILHYAWKDYLYYAVLSTTIVVLHDVLGAIVLDIPEYTIAALGVALAIFLGFKNNHAYDRWWEARKVWGLLVNYSRAWGRQVCTLVLARSPDEEEAVNACRLVLIRRHLAFVNALRVFLRQRHRYNDTGTPELYEAPNDYTEVERLLEPLEYRRFREQKNPPNFLLHRQGETLQEAFRQGWLSDYRWMTLEKTLVDFNDIQGISERIKNTPLPRQYTFFSRVFVLIHCSLLPMVFVSDLGWKTIPAALAVSFVFHALDLIGERTEDPFENRLEDVPLTALSVTIEMNLLEQLGEPLPEFPDHVEPAEDGIIL